METLVQTLNKARWETRSHWPRTLTLNQTMVGDNKVQSVLVDVVPRALGWISCNCDTTHQRSFACRHSAQSTCAFASNCDLVVTTISLVSLKKIVMSHGSGTRCPGSRTNHGSNTIGESNAARSRPQAAQQQQMQQLQQQQLQMMEAFLQQQVQQQTQPLGRRRPMAKLVMEDVRNERRSGGTVECSRDGCVGDVHEH